MPCIPEEASRYVAAWFEENHVHLQVTSSRASKYGDYRRSVGNIPARITINRDLNPYEFLITLVHEMAHHGVSSQGWFILNRGTISRMIGKAAPGPRPHGTEWKANYRNLMAPLLTEEIFPEDLLQVLKKHFKNPRATTKGDVSLVKALKKYDIPDGMEFVEYLPENSFFHLPDGRTFVKKEKLRKRYRCHAVNSRKIYLFSPIAKVYPGKPVQNR